MKPTTTPAVPASPFARESGDAGALPQPGGARDIESEASRFSSLMKRDEPSAHGSHEESPEEDLHPLRPNFKAAAQAKQAGVQAAHDLALTPADTDTDAAAGSDIPEGVASAHPEREHHAVRPGELLNGAVKWKAKFKGLGHASPEDGDDAALTTPQGANSADLQTGSSVPNPSALVLTPQQAQARTQRRKARGLDGGLHGQARAVGGAAAQHETKMPIGVAQTPPQSPTRPRALHEKDDPADVASLVAGVVPQQSVLPQPAPSVQAPAAAGAARSPQPHARLDPAAALAAGDPAAGPAVRSEDRPLPVGREETAQMEVPMQAVQRATDHQKFEAQGEAIRSESRERVAVDPVTGQPVQQAGPAPEPVREARAERNAQAKVAEVQAQELHIEVANTPESLPLELLKAL